MQDKAKGDAIAGTKLFGALATDRISEIAMLAMPRSYFAEQPVVQMGDDADGLYVVVSGTARVESLFAGSKKVVGQLTPGDVFGEVALLGGADKRTATVIAENDLQCLLLPLGPMKDLLQRHPEVREHLEALGQRRTTTNLQLHLGELPEIED
ncbi:MAG: cyclic nucleotide-binding domain-containing protein [Pseudomonadota bacterium]